MPPSNYKNNITIEGKEALTVLKRGGIILYPTDTVWGIGCDATNADAVSKVYALKNGKRQRPWSVWSMISNCLISSLKKSQK